MPIRAETDDLIAYLNALAELDPAFVQSLIEQRVPCNEAIAHHPSVQVGRVDGVHVAGFLGVLNGYAGTLDEGPRAGWGPIAAIYDGDGRLTHFQRTG